MVNSIPGRGGICVDLREIIPRGCIGIEIEEPAPDGHVSGHIELGFHAAAPRAGGIGGVGDCFYCANPFSVPGGNFSRCLAAPETIDIWFPNHVQVVGSARTIEEGAGICAKAITTPGLIEPPQPD
jgi:hypothetical protein